MVDIFRMIDTERHFIFILFPFFFNIIINLFLYDPSDKWEKKILFKLKYILHHCLTWHFSFIWIVEWKNGITRKKERKINWKPRRNVVQSHLFWKWITITSKSRKAALHSCSNAILIKNNNFLFTFMNNNESHARFVLAFFRQKSLQKRKYKWND